MVLYYSTLGNNYTLFESVNFDLFSSVQIWSPSSVLPFSSACLLFTGAYQYTLEPDILNMHCTLLQLGACCSVAKLHLTLWDPMDCSTPGFPVLHYLPEFAQIHVHWVHDAIQPSHPLSHRSPPALNLLQHQGLFQWVGSLHQVAKVLELQLQDQSFQWIFRVDLK